MTFDLDSDSATDYAEDVGFNNFIEPWEAFDVSIAAFAELLTRLIPRMYPGRPSDAVDFLSKFVACWSFEYKLALAAAMIRVDDFAVAAYAAPLLRDRDRPALAHRREDLPEALFRVLARGSWTAVDFARAFALTEDGPPPSGATSSQGSERETRGDFAPEGRVRVRVLPATLNVAILRKLTWLAQGDRRRRDGRRGASPRGERRSRRRSGRGRGGDASVDDEPEDDGLCSPRNTRVVDAYETKTKTKTKGSGAGFGSGVGSGGGTRTIGGQATPSPATPALVFATVFLSEE